ncbi:MAG: autotransporter outer membrane beta-barrel domain-containing protein [Treponema sp.]|jgi:hypothetical protein|nr:autotransporter outer membrane beta-barrel domain-containing protein [Treponema sp.]
MAKRIVLGLLVLAAVTGVLGAQEGSSPGAKMAASLDAFPLAKGIIWSDNDEDDSMFALASNFEYLLFPHFTVGGVMDMYFGKASDIDIFYFGLAAHGRWYPLSSGLDKLFLDAGLGFNVFSLDGETGSKKGGFAGMTISLKAGYKLMFGSHFFVEPSMAFVYAKTPSRVSVPTPLGWQPGLNIGAAF